MKRSVAIAILLFAAGCNEAQDPQKRYGTFSAALPPWQSSSEALQLPDGVVAQGDLERERTAGAPPAVTSALLERGRERFAIYCSPCHGYDGYADGIIVARGFPQPPSFHSQALRKAPAQLFYDTITDGYGAMYSYADRVSPSDRWAIAAFIRALQLSQLQARTAGP